MSAALPVLLTILTISPAWQQKVNYRIDVELDTIQHTLTGKEILVYFNNSPDTLKEIWLHLYPNAYRDRNSVWAREQEQRKNYQFSGASKKDRGYIEVDSVFNDDRHLKYEIDDTRMKVYLDKAINPGDSIVLTIKFFVKIPTFFSRLGQRGSHYEIVQWYPKVCAYDAGGWHNDYYHTVGEFYGEYGNFDVTITLPEEMIVGATGELIEPEKEIAFLDSFAIKGNELDSFKIKRKINRKPRAGGSFKRLRFYAHNVHDFAWAADKNFYLLREIVDSITVDILFWARDKEWCRAGDYAKDALRTYSEWYGPYPYKKLTIVRGYQNGGMEYPNLIIVGTGGSPFTRRLEQVIIHEIGHQWFYSAIGSNEMDEAWLDEGMTTFSEIRYFEKKYGPDKNYFKTGIIPGFNERWINKTIYYITVTNQKERPVLTKASEFASEPLSISYASAAYAKPALILFMLKDQIGDETFDRIMRRYYADYKFCHPRTSDFIKIVEREYGAEMERFFDNWLNTNYYCDYAIKRVDRKKDKTIVTIEKRGQIVMPIEVLAINQEGLQYIQRVEGDSNEFRVVFHDPKIKQVIIDPDEKILEINRWNNFSPSKIKVSPIFDIPSFDAYQIFYGPYANYSARTGFTLTAWLQGRQFVDYDLLLGRHQWSINLDYRTKIKKFFGGLSYQTPIATTQNLKMRTNFSINYGLWEFKIDGGIRTKISTCILAPDYHELSAGIGFDEIKTLDYVDVRDFEPGRVLSGRFGYRYKFKLRSLQGDAEISLQNGYKFLFGDFSFEKISTTLRPTFLIGSSLILNSRLLAGLIQGRGPIHNEFFLSGGVRLTGLSSILFSQTGIFSPQEHIHIDGGGNCTGYYGRHIHSSRILALNLEPKFTFLPLSPFFDAGYIPRKNVSPDGLYMDAGLKLKYGPVGIYFPIWVNCPEDREEKIKFRWVFELAL
ncbi:MAG: M1 family metallopeptidase [candidate division WOR-3 bacterium]